MKCYKATEPIGCVLETFYIIVNSLKTFLENEKRTYFGLAGAGPYVVHY